MPETEDPSVLARNWLTTASNMYRTAAARDDQFRLDLAQVAATIGTGWATLAGNEPLLEVKEVGPPHLLTVDDSNRRDQAAAYDAAARATVLRSTLGEVASALAEWVDSNLPALSATQVRDIRDLVAGMRTILDRTALVGAEEDAPRPQA